ncbi:MAG TPA: hypothetical protein VIP77_08340 [Jiangellaceae bacterium]
MNPAENLPVTGDRVPRKARRLAAQLPELGRIRHVEANPPSPTAWLVTIGFAVAFTVVISLGTGGVRGALVLVPVWAVLGLVILGYLGSEKVVVLDHGLLIGSFGAEDPGRRQRVVWWFGTWRQPDRLVHALESALVDLGHPVAGLSQQVLPMVRISGDPADATSQIPRLVAALEHSR